MLTAARFIHRSRRSARPACTAARRERLAQRELGLDVAEVFPVLIWIIGAHWHANLWFWPIAEDKTDVRVEFFAYKAEPVATPWRTPYFRTRLREVFREDVGTMEQVQGVPHVLR